MEFNGISYNHKDGNTYGVPVGESQEVLLDYDNNMGFILHPSEVWARAEQALLQEQRDAELAAERVAVLFDTVHSVLQRYIPRFDVGSYPDWVGTIYIANSIIAHLRDKEYIQ